MPSNSIDPLAFFEEISGYAEGYTPQDRYRDYRDVLVDAKATPEQAKRVLWDLFSQTMMFRSPIVVSDSRVSDTHQTFMRLGKQELGRWLLKTLTVEPGEPKPEQTKAQAKE